MRLLSRLSKLLTAPPPLDQLNATSLEDAKYQLEAHTQAREHHEAMIGMYTERIARLEPNRVIAMHREVRS